MMRFWSHLGDELLEFGRLLLVEGAKRWRMRSPLPIQTSGHSTACPLGKGPLVAKVEKATPDWKEFIENLLWGVCPERTDPLFDG